MQRKPAQENRTSSQNQSEQQADKQLNLELAVEMQKFIDSLLAPRTPVTTPSNNDSQISDSTQKKNLNPGEKISNTQTNTTSVGLSGKKAKPPRKVGKKSYFYATDQEKQKVLELARTKGLSTQLLTQPKANTEKLYYNDTDINSLNEQEKSLYQEMVEQKKIAKFENDPERAKRILAQIGITKPNSTTTSTSKTASGDSEPTAKRQKKPGT